MNCEQADELVGAYAVDALDAADDAAFREHIATCDRHAREAADLRAVAAHLPDSIEPIEPPPALRANLLAAIEREPQVGAADVLSIDDGRRERAQRQRDGRRWFRPNAWTAIAAALALLAIVAGAWAVIGGDSNGDELSAASDVRGLLDAQGQRVGTVLIYEDEGKAQVIFDDLAAAGAGSTYQMWSIEAGEPVSLAVMDPGASGSFVSVVDFDAASSDALAITVEPTGGSEQPTSDPVFVSTI